MKQAEQNYTPYMIFRVIAVLVITITLCGCGNAVSKESAVTQAEREPVKRATLIFGGDVMQHMPQIIAAKRDSTFDFSGTFRHLKPLFDSTDLVILNLETTISANGRYSGYPLFSAPEQLIDALKECGADALMLANNHICDKGAKGIDATIATIKKTGLKHTGAFSDSTDYASHNPLYLSAGGLRFALLNYTYGTNGMPIPKGRSVNIIDTIRIAADLRQVESSADADHTIILFHWGYEYSRKQSTAQKELALWCHTKGVDFVIGSHPHVIQPVETVRDSSGITRGITAYSLGNLVSNQRKRRTDGGMLLKIEVIHRDSTPVEINAEYLLTWVYVDQGEKNYTILPTQVADTMLISMPSAKSAYEQFVLDSRHLLATDSAIKEHKYRLLSK